MNLISINFLMLCLLTSVSFTLKAQDDVVKEGQQIPEFSIVSVEGQKISPATLKGNVVLINFFATWCSPCIKELPFLQKKVWEKYRKRNDFSLLVVGRGHDVTTIIKFQNKYEFDLPFYPDKDKSIYGLFANKYIPRNYIIDKEGKIVYQSTGYTEKEFELMIKELEKLLN